ncbi:hypothetical protein Pmani_039233 [Petrolisthes manimaculis]|uniref:Uncharacterized protein n=1 Tax=Petrolisthes manimaculis TaxID=1843537 RepID=A0AAE1ND24_9EUCA|nr:hypothetical protein Pmani_039233 [Petrolisthes manimaculis]
MLKWLVTRGPSSSAPHPPAPHKEGVTDDPLATLKLASSSNKKNHQQVYAVSRVNPLYEDDDGGVSEGEEEGEGEVEVEVGGDSGGGDDDAPPEPPETDRGSLRSSGYGSKETDSVSDRSEGQDEDDGSGSGSGGVNRSGSSGGSGGGVVGRVLAGPSGQPLATLLTHDPHYVMGIQIGMRRARSLEGLVPSTHIQPSQTHLLLPTRAATVPRPIWPRHSRPLPLPLPLLTPPPEPPPPPAPSVDLVSQDSRFVTAIAVSPNPPSSPAGVEWVGGGGGGGGGYWGGGGNGVSDDWGPDSLVTEETLAMMHHNGSQRHHQQQPPSPTPTPPSPTTHEPIYHEPIQLRVGIQPVVVPPRYTHTTPRTTSMLARGLTRPPLRPRRKSFDTGRPGGAVAAAAAALWERSGLKTNGRKLVVSLHHLDPTPPQTPTPPPRLNGLNNTNFISSSHSPPPPPPPPRLTELNNTTYTSSHSPHHLTGLNNTPFISSPHSPHHLTGLDNPAFIPDSECSRDVEAAKMAEFERRVCERLGGAPPHRTQWLELRDGGGGVGERTARRVTFTPDTHSPHPHHRRPPSPSPNVDDEGGGVVVGVVGEGSSTHHQQGIWTTSLSYHTRRQEGSGLGDGVGTGHGGQELWERYYGACGGAGDRTLPRHLAPHPNSGAPMCGQSNTCHDFTLDLRRADKLRRLTETRKRRRRWCSVVLVLVALTVFLGVVVAVSLYYTSGRRFFGPMGNV